MRKFVLPLALVASMASGSVALATTDHTANGTLKAIERASGTLLPGSSPDMAYSVALSLVMPNFVSVPYPLTVFGASRASGGGRAALPRNGRKLRRGRQRSGRVPIGDAGAARQVRRAVTPRLRTRR